MNVIFFEKTYRYIVIKILILAFVSEAWIISVEGCAWNENIITYLMIILFFMLIKKMDFSYMGEKKNVLKAFLITSIVTCFVWMGIVRWKISGEVIISHLNIKLVLVFIGYYFIGSILLQCFGTIKRERVILTLICAILTAVIFSELGSISIYSVSGWTVGIVLSCCANIVYFGGKHNYINSDKGKCAGFVLGFLAATMYILPNITQWKDKLNSPMRIIVFILFSLFILVPMLDIAIKCVFGWLSYFPVYESTQRGNVKKQFLIYLISLFVVWIPYFLAWYPGILSHDSISQMEQIMRMKPYSNHHPWLHTLLIQACFNLGIKISGDINIGVACYTVFSMLFMAFSAACGMVWLRKKGAAKWLRYINWCFWALFPINAVYMITMWKDVIFAGIVLLFLLALDNLIPKKEVSGKKSVNCFILFGILSFGVCFFRSNGMYAWLFLLPFLFLYFRRERKILCQLGITVGLVLLAGGFYKAAVLPLFQVSEPDFIESLSIPSQQIACVLNSGGEVTEEEYGILNEIVDTKKVAQDYKAYISDPVKYLVREKNNQDYLKENIKDYAKVYIAIGLRNPLLYLQGFVEQTKGYWYHKVNNWIYYPDGIRENNLGIFRTKLLPEKICELIENLVEKTEDFYHKFFSIALSSWMVLLGIGYSWMNKRTPIMFILQLGIILTLLIATPVSAEFRYMYAVFWSLPVIWSGLLCDSKKE